MDALDVAVAVVFGFVGGMAGGLLGIGGAALFVPGLVFALGFSQLEAQATALVSILPVAVVGGWRQHRYGNLRLRDGLLVGALSPLGVAAGTVLANRVPQRALELGFAAFQLYVAYRLTRRALSPADAGSAGA